MTQHGGRSGRPDLPAHDPGPARGVDRRTVLALGGALALAGLTAAPAAATSTGPLPAAGALRAWRARRPVRDRAASVRRARDFLTAATDAYPAENPGPRLAQSYADQLGLFSTAFVYDNALAILATLTAGAATSTAPGRSATGSCSRSSTTPTTTTAGSGRRTTSGPTPSTTAHRRSTGSCSPTARRTSGGSSGSSGRRSGTWPGRASRCCTCTRRHVTGATWTPPGGSASGSSRTRGRGHLSAGSRSAWTARTPRSPTARPSTTSTASRSSASSGP